VQHNCRFANDKHEADVWLLVVPVQNS